MHEIINILFIEENASDTGLVLQQIEKEGIRFSEKVIGTRQDLITGLTSFNPDILISGYMLDSMNGMEVLKIRNELAPGLPCIIFTALSDENVAVECMKLGADDFILKRDMSHLGGSIISALSKREFLHKKNEAEQQLKESEEKYRSMADHNPDAVLIQSGGKVLYANPVALKLLRAESFESIKDTDLVAFIHPDYLDRSKDWFRKIDESGSPQGFTEARLINMDQETIDIEIIGIPVMYHGEPAVQTIVRDISQRKRFEEELVAAKEKAEESDRLKTAFLHNISHEIRTPMNAIVGFAALLNEPDLSPDTRDSYLQIITESSDQLLAIVNDIIEISNIEVGMLKTSINEINLNSLMMKVYQQFSRKAVERGLEFRMHTSLSGHKSQIRTDDVKLIQILSNLLGNAFKFTKKGRISFGYTLEGDHLEFFVSDTGIGISEELHDKIFERFYQVENTSTRSYEGTGLGLSIAKAYVELLGGRIWLGSQPGRGSTFYFSLPFLSTKRQYVNEMDSAGIDKGVLSPEKSILIAEDDDNNFFLMKELLSEMNLKIIRASNGMEAVDAFKTGEKIDLVLMDIKMPGMDGYEATRQILAREPHARILAQTAYADDEVKALESGCMGFISKPFVKDRFVSLVREYL